MLLHSITFIFWIACILFLIGLIKRSLLWRKGKPFPIEWNGIFAIPKRYFIDLHNIVATEPYIARAHILTAGGASLIVLVTAVNFGLAQYSFWLNRILLLGSAIMLTGCALMAWRRLSAPQRLSKGAWIRLSYTLMIFACGSILAAYASPESGQIYAMLVIILLIIGSSELVFGIMGGPMKHAAAGLLHLAFHPRSERFSGKLSTALRLLPLEKKEYGIYKISDFAWNRLLSFDACVQCGKCEAVCPAFATGQPLNPKKLIQDLVTGLVSKSDANYAGSSHPGQTTGQHFGTPNSPIVPQLISSETIWSCTTCRACVQECPMMIEHVDAIVDIRRNQTMVQGTVPGKGAQVLENLRYTDTINGFSKHVRYQWATDLNIPVLKPKQETDWLVIAGEGAFDMRYQRALYAFISILKHANLKFAILGESEIDCGDLARRLGDEATFQTLANTNINMLKQLAFKHIVTPDPHVYHCLKNEYPALGGHFDVWHHSALLAKLFEDNQIRLKKSASISKTLNITYHDPCYLGRYNNEYGAPRKVLHALNITITEMERSKKQGRCCGGGGGAAFTDIPGKTRIPDIRIKDAQCVGAETIVVACPNCTNMLEGVVGTRPKIMELSEIVIQNLGN